MTRSNRIDALRQQGEELGSSGLPIRIEQQLLDFAGWRLPQAEAVALLGESQLDQWRLRMVNLVRWNCVRRAAGESPGLGDGIQIASQIASYPPDVAVPSYLDPRMTYARDAYLRSTSTLSRSYLIQALLAVTLLGGPDGMPLRRWIADHAPDAWDSEPQERDGYHLLVWIGPREAPFETVEAILAMEGEVLDDPWNVDDVPSWPYRGLRRSMR